MSQGASEYPLQAVAAFRTTQWSAVLAAGSGNSTEAEAALGRLAERYWYPLYAYIRRRGHSHQDAADLTQSFFVQILEKKTLAGLTPGIARFRCFLLTALKNFLANEWDRSNRLKRGGGKKVISLDDSTANEL